MAVRLSDTRGFKWVDAKEQQQQFSAAWNGFLRLPLPENILLDVLSLLPSDVMPYLATPLTLSDFLTHALNREGNIGLLALKGIFILMTEHNLEYPDFYKRVYSLLNDDVFSRTDRSNFFHLLDRFLKSGLVPAYTQAAFIKKFARLALRASPQGAVVCITFIHNLIRRHPACNVLLDRQNPGERPRPTTEYWYRYDCFDEKELDPAMSRAIESSLWETEALGNHYCHQVSDHARILLKDLTKRSKSSEKKLESVSCLSYSDLIRETLNQDVQQQTSVAVTRLFEESDEVF